jgi:hypothetical protein
MFRLTVAVQWWSMAAYRTSGAGNETVVVIIAVFNENHRTMTNNEKEAVQG